MKIFNMREHYNEDFMEYIIGSQEIGRHGVYLVYGEAREGERREMGSGGHEEIILLLSGEAVIESSVTRIPLKKEQAVYSSPEESPTFLALADCTYIVAGGHAAPHHH